MKKFENFSAAPAVGQTLLSQALTADLKVERVMLSAGIPPVGGTVGVTFHLTDGVTSIDIVLGPGQKTASWAVVAGHVYLNTKTLALSISSSDAAALPRNVWWGIYGV